MSLRLLFLALALLAAGHARAQDLLTKRNGDEVRVHVLEITPLEVKYRRTDDPDGPLVSVSKTEVFAIRYANGDQEVLGAAPAETGAPADPLLGLADADRQALGRRDAAAHYRSPGAFWGSAGAALGASPVYGAAVPIVISIRQVKPDNFQAPNPVLLGDPSYRRGYQQQASRAKRQRAWAGYAAGTGAWAVLVTVVLAVAVSHL